MLEFVLERSRRSGLESVSLEVRTSNTAAITLYEKFGFVVAGRRAAYYPNGEDALLMIYNLNAAAD
jgi:ribosomal-protein-alanine N-acetyltransferase